MKRLLAVLFLLVLMLGLGTAVVYATPTPTPPIEGIDLRPLDLTWSDEFNPGNKTTFILTYTNMGTETIPPDTTTTITLALLDIENEKEVIKSPTKSITVGGMIFGETRVVTHTLIAPEEKAYTIVAEIAALPDETVSDNNKIRKPINVTSALPPEIANLFAGLGMFAAVMAVVAVGTEVVVDSVRVLLGLKRKVTALEALDRLQSQIPGQLAELGVSAPKLEEFNNHVKELKKNVEPTVKVAETAIAIREGKLGDIVLNWFVEQLADEIVITLQAPFQGRDDNVAKRILTIQPKEIIDLIDQLLAEETPPNVLDELFTNDFLKIDGKTLEEHGEITYQDFVKKVVDNIKGISDDDLKKSVSKIADQLDEWMETLKLSKYFRDKMKLAVITTLNGQIANIKTEINRLTPDTVYEWLKNIRNNLNALFDELGKISNEQGSEAAADWLEQQGETLVTLGSKEVMGRFDNEFRPFLKALGLPEGQLDDVRNRLDKGIGYLSNQAQAASAQYVTSLKELLLAVESRRNDMQSPFRKIWRSIRNSSYPIWLIVLFEMILIILVLLLFALNIIDQLNMGNIWIAIAILLAFISIAVTHAQKQKFLEEANKYLNQKDTKVLEDILKDLAKESKTEGNTLGKVKIVNNWLKEKDITATAEEFQTSNFRVFCQVNFYLENPKKLRVPASSRPSWNIYGLNRANYSLFSFGDLLFYLESAWNFVIGRPTEHGQLESGITRLISELDEDFAGTKVAAILQQRSDQHRDEEASRLRWLRVISLVIGTVLAISLRIDAAVLLDAVIPDVSDLINSFVDVTIPIGEGIKVTAGMILTGLAASAGSAFWHDQLDRLQAAKRGAEEAAKLLRDIQGSELTK